MRERITTYATEQLACVPDAVFAEYPDYLVLRHPLSNKWAAILMDIPTEKINAGGPEHIDVMNVKLDPFLVASLKGEPGYAPAWHMSKTHWLTVRLDGSVPFDQTCALLDMSYELVGPKKHRKK